MPNTDAQYSRPIGALSTLCENAATIPLRRRAPSSQRSVVTMEGLTPFGLSAILSSAIVLIREHAKSVLCVVG